MRNAYQPRLPDRAVEGEHKANCSTIGVANLTISNLLQEYYSLNTPVARNAYALRWVELAAPSLEDTWELCFNLLDIIDKHELYKSKYESFKAYFEAVMGQPFTKWREMVESAEFVKEYPEYCLQTFSEVRTEIDRMVAEREAKGEMNKNGGNRNPYGRAGKPKEREYNQCDILPENVTLIHNIENNKEYPSGERGNNNLYRLGKLERDHPDIYQRFRQGEFGTNVAAAERAARGEEPFPPRKKRESGFFIPLDKERAARKLREMYCDDDLIDIFKLVFQKEDEL